MNGCAQKNSLVEEGVYIAFASLLGLVLKLFNYAFPAILAQHVIVRNEIGL